MLKHRLKNRRKDLGLTQDQLADIVNTKKSTISNYETGYSSPNPEMLRDLADALKTTTDFLLGRSNDPTDQSSFQSNRLRNLRKERSLTQNELGEKLSLDESTISAYETGSLIPDLDTVNKLSSFFGVTVDYLMGRSISRVPDAGRAYYGGGKDWTPEEIVAAEAYIEMLRQKQKEKEEREKL